MQDLLSSKINGKKVFRIVSNQNDLVLPITPLQVTFCEKLFWSIFYQIIWIRDYLVNCWNTSSCQSRKSLLLLSIRSSGPFQLCPPLQTYSGQHHHRRCVPVPLWLRGHLGPPSIATCCEHQRHKLQVELLAHGWRDYLVEFCTVDPFHCHPHQCGELCLRELTYSGNDMAEHLDCGAHEQYSLLNLDSKCQSTTNTNRITVYVYRLLAVLLKYKCN